MKHRHLDYAPDTVVGELPSAAIVDLFERGDLADWQPVLASITRDPDGAFARRVPRLVDRFPMYGTSPLIRTWIDRAQAATRLAGLVGDAVPLKHLRLRRGLTQTKLAERMDMSQSDLSKLERRQDVRLSTLRSYVEALDGRLTLIAALPSFRCAHSTLAQGWLSLRGAQTPGIPPRGRSRPLRTAARALAILVTRRTRPKHAPDPVSRPLLRNRCLAPTPLEPRTPVALE